MTNPNNISSMITKVDTIIMSIIKDANLYTNLCTKILCGNGHNTCCTPYKLKLDNIDYHIICHMGFGAQVGIPNIMAIIIYELW